MAIGAEDLTELTAEMVTDGIVPRTPADRFRASLVGAGISGWGMRAATGEVGALDGAVGGSSGWDGIGPREGHWIRERDHQLDLLRRTREWFDRWLAPTSLHPESVDDGTAAATDEIPSVAKELAR